MQSGSMDSRRLWLDTVCKTGGLPNEMRAVLLAQICRQSRILQHGGAEQRHIARRSAVAVGVQSRRRDKLRMRHMQLGSAPVHAGGKCL